MLWCFTFVTQGPGFSLQALSRRRAAAFLEGKSVCCDFSELTGVYDEGLCDPTSSFHDMEHEWDLFHLWRFGLQLRTGVSTGSQFTSLDWAMFRCWARWLHIRPAACGILWLCQLKLCQLGDGHREGCLQDLLTTTISFRPIPYRDHVNGGEAKSSWARCRSTPSLEGKWHVIDS